MCSFGSRALGHGIYTFDRRLHHLRSALSSMLEQHISTHLWKYVHSSLVLLLPSAGGVTGAGGDDLCSGDCWLMSLVISDLCSEGGSVQC